MTHPKERVEFNDRVSSLGSDRDDLWLDLFVSLTAIPNGITQADRDARAKPIIDRFFADNKALDKEREDTLLNRNKVPYPPENCGQDKPNR